MAFGTTPVEGAEYELWNTTNRKVKSALWGGRLRVRYGSNKAGVIAAGGQVNLVRMEVGEAVMGGRLFWNALGSSTKIWLGHAGDCDGYKTMSDGNTAVPNQTVGTPASQIPGDCSEFNGANAMGYEITSTTQDVIFTVGLQAATSSLSAGDIKVAVFYAKE